MSAKILMMLSCEVAKMHEDIAADPPDPNFADGPTARLLHVAVIRPTRRARWRRRSTGRRRTASRLASGLAVPGRAGHGQRGRAATSDSTRRRRVRLRPCRRLRTTADALRDAAASTEPAVEKEPPVKTAAGVIPSERWPIGWRRPPGSHEAEKTQLRALGATDAEIVNVRTWFDREFDIAPGVTLDSTLLEIADGFDAAVGATDAFARQVSAVVVDGASVNATPVARFGATPTTGVAPLNVSFDGTASSDSDGTIASYVWDFGDASTGAGPTVEHVYATVGSYIAALTVTDDRGGTASTSKTISVSSGGGGGGGGGGDPGDSTRWVLMNDQGLLAQRFGSSEGVYVTGIPAGGGIFPANDVYVVPNSAWSGVNQVELHDVSNADGIPNTVVGFEVIQQPIYPPYLRVGQYDVVFDVDQDGVYDAGVDEVLGFGSSAGFDVVYDGNGRGIDKARLKAELGIPVAQAARTADSAIWSGPGVPRHSVERDQPQVGRPACST